MIAFGIKQDAVPGYINEAWTRIDRPGIYYGQCAELCGINHAYMPIVVIAMTENDFNNWVIQQKGGTPITPPQSTTVTTPAPISLPTTTPSGKKSTLADLMPQGERL